MLPLKHWLFVHTPALQGMEKWKKKKRECSREEREKQKIELRENENQVRGAEKR